MPGGEIFGEAIFGPTEPEVVHRDFASVVEEQSERLVHCFTCRWAVHLLIQCGDCPGIEIREAEEIRAQIWIGARRKSEKNGAGTLQILEVHPVKSTWKCSSGCFRFTWKLVHFGFPAKLELLLLVSYIALPGFSNASSRNLAAVPQNVIAWAQGLHRWCTNNSVTLRT